MALAVNSVPPAGTLCGLRVLSAGPRPAPGTVARADRDARDGRCGWAEAAVCVQPGRVLDAGGLATSAAAGAGARLGAGGSSQRLILLMASGAHPAGAAKAWSALAAHARV